MTIVFKEHIICFQISFSKNWFDVWSDFQNNSKMVSSFEIFINTLQDKIRDYDFLSGRNKSEISDVIWRRLTQTAKNWYNVESKHVNAEYGNRGKKKISGYWFFATILIKELQKKQLDDIILFELFESLDDKNRERFYSLNRCIFSYRRMVLYDILNSECPILMNM